MLRINEIALFKLEVAMKKLVLLTCLFLSSASFASLVKVNLVKIKLNPIDSFGLFKVHGDLKINVDSQSYDVDSVDSEFIFKAVGFGLGESIKENFDVDYNTNITLIDGDEIALKGFNSDDLASIVINKPLESSNGTSTYELNVNHLLGFGSSASSACKKTSTLKFKLIQNKMDFKLMHPNHQSVVTEIKFFIEALGKEKKLAHIELVSKDKTSVIKYKGCEKVTK